MTAPATQKAELRREMRRRLRTLDPPSRAGRSREIVARLGALPAWRAAKRVLLFAPLATEPDLDLLWSTDGLLEGKRCAYPRVDGVALKIYEVEDLADLETGPWSLREPPIRADAELAPGSFDVILVPGVAWTREGRRLGRGGGYYDRLLASAGAAPTRIGIAFAFQLVVHLPTEAHDAAVNMVICDEGRPLDWPATSDELDQHDDDRQHQQNVNEVSDGKPADEAERPENE